MGVAAEAWGRRLLMPRGTTAEKSKWSGKVLGHPEKQPVRWESRPPARSLTSPRPVAQSRVRPRP